MRGEGYLGIKRLCSLRRGKAIWPLYCSMKELAFACTPRLWQRNGDIKETVERKINQKRWRPK